MPIALTLLAYPLRRPRSQRGIELGFHHLLDDVTNPFSDRTLNGVAVELFNRFAFQPAVDILPHGRPPSAPAAKRAQLFGLIKQPQDDAFSHFPPDSRHYPARNSADRAMSYRCPRGDRSEPL
jgi:hypothetical protein